MKNKSKTACKLLNSIVNEIKIEINFLNSAVESIINQRHDKYYSPIGDAFRYGEANQTIEILKKILVDAGYNVDITKNEVKVKGSAVTYNLITSLKINDIEIYTGD